jgi:hypothetical protein
MARETISQVVIHSEIFAVDIPQQPKAFTPSDEVPWEWFGVFKDDATWGALFEEIERSREASRKGY